MFSLEMLPLGIAFCLLVVCSILLLFGMFGVFFGDLGGLVSGVWFFFVGDFWLLDLIVRMTDLHLGIVLPIGLFQ